MNINVLTTTAKKMVTYHRGLLAIDESAGTVATPCGALSDGRTSRA